jgi:hypothetical protein
MVRKLSWKTPLVAAACFLLAACDRDAVSYFRVPKPSPPPVQLAAAQGAMAGDVAAPARPASGGLRWTLPKGWTESAGGQMRYATLKPPVQGKIDASVVVLPGPAGGELANVNRWRNQIGLPPIDEAGLAAARKVLRTKAGPLNVYDFVSGGKTGSRLVAGLTQSGGNTWFVKLTGDAGAVGAAREDFMKLLGSLRIE